MNNLSFSEKYEYNVVLGGKTKLIGNWANSAATIALPLGNNVFIIASAEKHLKMVRIKIQGEVCFEWINARKHKDQQNYPAVCKDPLTFTEACFSGPAVDKENYSVQLVAERKSNKRRKRQQGNSMFR